MRRSSLALCAIAVLMLTLFPARAQETPKVPIGINLLENNDWSRNRMWVNMINACRRWGPVDKSWEDASGIKVGENGYPVGPASCQHHAYEYPAGEYVISHAGKGKVEVDGRGKLTGEWKSENGRSAATVTMAPEIANNINPVYIRIRETDAADPVRDIQLRLPGYADTAAFSKEFLSDMKPFVFIRYMDFMRTNGNNSKEWSERSLPDAPNYEKKGAAWEMIIKLSNEVKRDAWISIPYFASDGYIRELARLFAKEYDPALNLYIENANELWNGAYGFDTGQAHMDKYRAAGDWDKAWRDVAKRMCDAAKVFRAEFGGRASKIRPVLAGQIVNPTIIDKGMEYIQASDPECKPYAISGAPYVNIGSGEVSVASLDEVFKMMEDNLENGNKKLTRQLAEQARKYNVKFNLYEFGQHLTGEASMEIKSAAQDDPRMAQVLQDAICYANVLGIDGIGYFAYMSDKSKWGSWGLKERISQPSTTKWDMVMSMLRNGCPISGSAASPARKNASAN